MSEISRQELHAAIEDKLCAHFGVTAKNATDEQIFQAAAIVIRELMSRHLAVQSDRGGKKEVCYLSMEFLLGRSLMKNAFNLGVAEALTGALEDMGRSASDIFEQEPDAGLGNGGLGRLAACYSDSMATLDIPATCYSLCYELGLFKQVIRDGKQTEVADDWRAGEESWLVTRPEDICEVRFGGHVAEEWDWSGTCHTTHTGYTSVLALPRDMLIAGYGDRSRVNRLRLWDAKSPQELDMYLFSGGKYVEALAGRTMAEVITKVLYPADDHREGKELRLKQQYFFVSATAQDIVRRQMRECGELKSFAERHAIQINDTHPTLIIPELMRLFMDEHGLGWDEAYDLVSRAVAYTNHTVMSEALERWPQDLVQSLMPRVWQIISEINRRWAQWLIEHFGNDREAVEKNLILFGGEVHMANLCQAVCHTINGVSRLHGEILQKRLFSTVCSVRPERYTSVTNGIDHRRWLTQINPRLDALITDCIGAGYRLKPAELGTLRRFESDGAVLERLETIKRANKETFAAWFARTQGERLDPSAILDVQIKRLHEYKRQLLCAMLIEHLRERIHDAPNAPFMPRSFVFGAKAAGSYTTAKRIIELLIDLGHEINTDPLCKGKLQVFFLENYRVSAAEVLIPAAQVSEQISTAGKEASGTGCMKLMANGAVTIGTLDGANVEMYERLGAENMQLFGLTEQQVESLRPQYDPRRYYESDPTLRRVLDRFAQRFPDLVSGLVHGGDPYMLLADFDSYVRSHDALYARIGEDRERARMSLVNIAQSGFFAADRAIEEYASNIWNI